MSAKVVGVRLVAVDIYIVQQSVEAGSQPPIMGVGSLKLLSRPVAEMP